MLILSDIDGTVANTFPLVKKHIIEENNWEKFYSVCYEAEPIWPIVSILKVLQEFTGNEIAFMTGRPDSQSTATRLWICQKLWYITSKQLLMRTVGDKRFSWEIKVEWAKIYKPDLVLDDEPAAVEALGKLGIPVLQVHGFRGVDECDRIPPC